MMIAKLLTTVVELGDATVLCKQ